ncbi:MAG: glycosyltransferase family 2 protein [Terriglobia bacterium]
MRLGHAESEIEKQPVQESRPLVAISILNWNGWEDTLECLESVLQLDYPNFLILVADNGSRDDSAERIKDWAVRKLGAVQVLGDYDRTTALRGGDDQKEQRLNQASSPARMVLIRNGQNLGFAGGNNITIQYALARNRPADFVLLLNNDAMISPNCLARLVETIDKAKAGIAEAAVFPAGAQVPEGPWIPPHWQIQFEKFFGEKMGPFPARDNYQEVIAAHGSAMIMRSETLRAVRLAHGEYLHERFFMYLEDVGISVRARKLGYSCIRVNDAEVRHKGAASSGGKYNCREYYYSHRNALLLSRELSRAGRFIVRVVNLPRALGRVAKNILHRRYAAAQAIASGLFDGYRGVSGKWKRHDPRDIGPDGGTPAGR